MLFARHPLRFESIAGARSEDKCRELPQSLVEVADHRIINNIMIDDVSQREFSMKFSKILTAKGDKL